jgi:hypothetical protein
VAAEIRSRDPKIGILVLSTFAEARYASQLMDAVSYGVGYLLKDNVMAEGRSNVGIAKDLHLSPRTVEAHVTSVFTKLGLDQTDTDNNRVRAVLTFLRSSEEGTG